MFFMNWWNRLTKGFLKIQDGTVCPERYRNLRRNIIILMVVITIVPSISICEKRQYKFGGYNG